MSGHDLPYWQRHERAIHANLKHPCAPRIGAKVPGPSWHFSWQPSIARERAPRVLATAPGVLESCHDTVLLMTEQKADESGQPHSAAVTAPARSSWGRWRWVAAPLGIVLLAGGRWEQLTSGEPFAILTAVGVIAFFVSLLWRIPGAPPRDRRADPEAWRAHARDGAVFFGVWFVVACLWLGAAAVLYEVRPANFFIPGIPASLTLLSLLRYRGADRAAALHARAETRRR